MGRNCLQEASEMEFPNEHFKHKNKASKWPDTGNEEDVSNGDALVESKKKKKKHRQITEDDNAKPNDEIFNGLEKQPKQKKKTKTKHKQQFDGFNEISNTTAGISNDKRKKRKQRDEEVLEQDCREAEVITEEEEEKKKEKREKKDHALNEAEDLNDQEESVDNIEVSASGKGSDDPKYRPLETFDASGLPENVLRCCKSFKKPSPIQAYAWPYLLQGRDFIGIAATGSGKTIAFGVPALMHILKKDNRKSKKNSFPVCLVLSPTRELAQQTAAVLSNAGSSCNVRCICLYGGVSKGQQISEMRSGMDIIVATPGRLKDFIDDGLCKLHEVSFVVLDEADRMLDLGFEPEVRAILSKTASARQTVMFSATWPLAVHQLAQEFMDKNPIKELAANHDVMQIVEVLDEHARDKRLVSLLEKYHKSRRNRVIVFVLYKKEASRVESMLQRRGWNAAAVHGDKSQSDRTKAVSLFKDGKCPLLIATDVAARGLDIPDVEVVINYSFPLTTEDYVHRIGRTGRAGKKGVAHTFFTQLDKARAGELVNVLREAGQIVPDELLKFGTHVKKKESKLYGAHFKEINANAPKAKKITFADSDDD
eukprot:TRINITY_DN23380_c0_g1_i2.p1 TRINITY_DN23380_c0_g1~~TRINITY_DN23380_c0_g1_i2.p1  ORF type:complete len:595 (-),score=161.42 TRINITY_DN23380_c0_g1_i2:586-2370(-)